MARGRGTSTCSLSGRLSVCCRCCLWFPVSASPSRLRNNGSDRRRRRRRLRQAGILPLQDLELCVLFSSSSVFQIKPTRRWRALLQRLPLVLKLPPVPLLSLFLFLLVHTTVAVLLHSSLPLPRKAQPVPLLLFWRAIAPVVRLLLISSAAKTAAKTATQRATDTRRKDAVQLDQQLEDADDAGDENGQRGQHVDGGTKEVVEDI